MSVCGGGAGGGGETRKTDTSKRKDVKKDGGTQEKRGERLVKNSKYIYFNVICSAEAFFFCTSPRAHRLCAAWINCGSGSEKVLRVIETGIGGSGVGICTVACDGAVNGLGWRGGNGALTPLSLLRLKTHQPLTHSSRHRCSSETHAHAPVVQLII